MAEDEGSSSALGGVRIEVAVWLARRGEDVLAVRPLGLDDVFYLPGGLVEPGESPVDAVAREVAEELGHVVGPSELALVATLEAEAFGRDGTSMSFHVFAGGPLPATFRPQPDEIADVVWLPADRHGLFAPAIRRVLQQLRATTVTDAHTDDGP